jgi:ABC-type phosphate transport system substrate-binding protein
VQEGVVTAASQISNTIGYSGLDGVYEWGKLSQNFSCRIKIAALINKAGKTVMPSVTAAQAAVRSCAISLLEHSSCPGFGICGNIQDGEDADVWPITAISVSFLTAMTKQSEAE